MPQTTFLGATVKQVNLNAAFGLGSPSQANIALIVDAANGDVWNPPEIGSPVYFEMGSLSFNGLLQFYGKTEDVNGYPAYEATVIDPREILDGAQVVLGGYSGTTGSIPNLLNVYGWWEAQSYGASGSGEGGMLWSQVAAALLGICNQPEQTAYGGPLLYRGYSYGLDLSQLPSMPANYRVGNALSVSLLELIALICEDAGHDFMVELVGSTIRIRTQSRRTQPNLAYLEALRQTYKAQGILVRSKVGVESRNEITSAFLFGGDRRIVHESSSIASFWGFSPSNQPILGIPGRLDLVDVRYRCRLEGGVAAGDTVLVFDNWTTTDSSCTWDEFQLPFYVAVDYEAATTEIIRLDELLDAPGPLQGRVAGAAFRCSRGQFGTQARAYAQNKNCVLNYYSVTTERFALNAEPVADIFGLDQYYCTEFELRLAAAGFAGWAAYVRHFYGHIADRIGLISPLLNNKGGFGKVVQDLINDLPGVARAWADGVFGSDEHAKAMRFYEWLKGYADEYMGRKYAVSVPLVSFKADAETGRITTSYEVDDGGWLPEELTPLGLPQLDKDVFRTQDGRYRAFCRYDDVLGADFNRASPENTVLEGVSRFWVGLDVDPNLIYTPSPAVVVTVQGPLFDQAQDNFGGAEVIAAVLQLPVERASEVFRSAAWGNLGARLSPAARTPTRMAIPLRSNIETYGPWYRTGAQGRVKIEQDPGMVPWNYGSDALLNAAGDARVIEATTAATAVEAGQLELVGTPLVSLGDALQENGPVVTSMQVSVGTQGWQTTYHFQTFTPRFGVFARGQQERLRRISLAQSQLRRSVRMALKGNLLKQANAQNAARVQKQFMQGAPKAAAKQSPHDVLVAQTYADELGGTVRTGVSAMTFEEAVGGVNANDSDTFQRTAAMGLAGLLRPFSTKVGSTSMSSYAAHQASFSGGLSRSTLDPWKSADTDIEIWTYDSAYWGMHAKRWGGNNEEARVIGLRAPAVMVGFGLSTDCVPVPGDGAGNWSTNYLTNPVQWKAGPVDLLWDERRGVWTCHDVAKGTATSDIAASMGGSGCVRVYRDGTATDWTVWAYNWSASQIASGTNCLLFYEATSNKWLASSTATGGAGNPPTPTGLFTFHTPEFTTGGGQPSLISANWGGAPTAIANTSASGSSYLFSMSDHTHAHGVFPTGNLHPEYNLPTGIPYSVLCWNSSNQKEWQRDPTLSGVYLGGAGIGTTGHAHFLNHLGSGTTVRCGQNADRLWTVYLPDNVPASGSVLGVVTHVAGGIVTGWVTRASGDAAYRYQFHQPEFVVSSGDPTTVQANWGTATAAISTAGSAGVAELFARSDHVHAHPVLGGDLHPEYNLPTGVPYTGLCLNASGVRVWERRPHYSGVVLGGSGIGCTGFAELGNPLGSGYRVMSDSPDRLWSVYLPNNVPVSGQMLTVIQATGDTLRTHWQSPPSTGAMFLPYTRVSFGNLSNEASHSTDLTFESNYLGVVGSLLGGGYRATTYSDIPADKTTYALRRARGTSTAPGDSVAGDHIGRFVGQKMFSSAFVDAFYLDVFAGGSGNVGGSGVFRARGAGETDIFSLDGTTGKVRVHSLSTDALVGTDSLGRLQSASIGTGLSYSNGTLTNTNTGTVYWAGLTQPAAGLTVTGSPITASGSFTLALADDLAAVEGLGGSGIAVRASGNFWTTRNIAGTSDRVTVQHGEGIAGNPTVDIAATYVGQASITTLGTIATGTWRADTLKGDKGGTDQPAVAVGDLLAGSGVNSWGRLTIGASGTLLHSNGVSPHWTKVNLAGGSVSGVLPVANLPGVQVYSGSFTRDMSTATGDQSITGVGFKPKALVCINCGTVGGNDQCSTGGTDDGTTHGCVETGGTAGNCFMQSTFSFIWRVDAGGANFQRGVVSTFDNDGFTVTWTKVGTPTGTATVSYIAIR